ncbi:MAG TPA: hypothetical protein PK639_00360 [Candidatus Woesebacteria bacterium]|nr:hypothetical protein [Candidatus Woesebacteria bacterium]
MIWQIFGAIFCLGWTIYFGKKLIKQFLINNSKLTSIIVILISGYFAVMFIDMPFQIFSCVESLGNQPKCNITLSVGIDCMPKIDMPIATTRNERLFQSILNTFNPISVRENIFGNNCVSY